MLTFERALPEETGIPSGCILKFIDRLNRHKLPMHSILLMHRDKLITEGYYAPCMAEDLHRMFSITKSFTAIAIGLLADEGRLSLDDPIIQYFPDKVPANVHPFIASMTIRDMLMMRSCHASTTYKLDMKKDWVESFFTTTPTHPAGRLFHYDTSSPHTLCALVERLSGMPMLSYLKKKLSVLGLSESSYLLTDPFGVSLGGTGLVATSMDLLKFAWLIAHDGNVNGSQLISSSYLKEATSLLTDTMVTAPLPSEAQGYGYQFWRNERGGFTCYGMGGQLIIFLPDYEFICITTADTQGMGGGNQLIYDALYEEVLPEILPCMSEAGLPISDEKISAYTHTINNLHMQPLTGAFTSSVAASVNGKTFTVSPNQAGFESFTVSPGCLSFVLNGKDFRIAFGFGSLETGSFPIYNLRYAASGVWLSEQVLYVKAHIIDSCVGSVHFELSFGKNDLTVFMKKQEESLFQEFDGHLYCTC